MPSRPAPLLIGSDTDTIAAIPAKQRKNVPIASAKSCLAVYMDRDIPREPRTVKFFKALREVLQAPHRNLAHSSPR
jgi:hypothetical protein